MYKTFNVDINEIEYVLENLSDLTRFEVESAFGVDYKKEILAGINCAKEKQLIKLNATNETVGVFGLIEESKDVAGIFFLPTKNLCNGNMIKFLRVSKCVIEEWLKKYKLLLDDCFVENKKIVKWLHFLGFKVCPEDKNGKIRTFYKGNLQARCNDDK